MAQETQERFVVSVGPGAGNQTVRLFLCHNSADKLALREIAEAIEHEHGVKNFLDVHAIPAGVEFIPFIRNEIAACNGCAIFLGGNGWGPTHLWEAQELLSRYRKDPTFKLIPVVLSGVTEAAMQQLGDGSVFAKMNWVDFRETASSLENVRKLFAAFSGKVDVLGWADRGVTPYILKRDARKWKLDPEANASLLYSGSKLREAQQLLAEAASLLDAGEAAAFLQESERKQRRFWQRTAVASVAAAVALIVLAGFAWWQRDLAEQRQVLASSRLMSLASRSMQGADQQLLVAGQALAIKDTPEARSVMIDQLTHWSQLIGMLHLRDEEATALAFDAGSKTVIVGTASGKVFRIKVVLRGDGLSHEEPVEVLSSPADGSVTALAFKPGLALVAGFASGRVEGLRNWQDKFVVRAELAAVTSEGGALSPRDVRAMAFAPSSPKIAIGDGSGRLELISLAPDAARSSRDLSDRIRITALLFFDDQRLLAATGDGTLELIDAADPGLESKDVLPNRDEIIAIGRGTKADEVVTVSASAVVTDVGVDRMSLSLGRGTVQLPAFLSSATVDSASGRIGLGYGDGKIDVREIMGAMETESMPVHPHKDPVTALVFAEDRKALIASSRNGSLSVWSMGPARSPLAQSYSHLRDDLTVLEPIGSGDILAGALEPARVWRRRGSEWQQSLDITKLTEARIPNVEPEPPVTASGFAEILGPKIANLALAGAANLAVWVTRDGALLSSTLDAAAASQRTDCGDVDPASLSVAGDGHVAAIMTKANDAFCLFDPRSTDRAASIVLVPAGTRALKLSYDGTWLARGDDAGRIVVFATANPSSTAASREILGGGPVDSMLFSPAGDRIVVAGAGPGADRRGIVMLSSDLQDSVDLPLPANLNSVATGLTISPDGRTLAGKDSDGGIHLWDLGFKGTAGTINVDGRQTGALAFLPDGRLLAQVATGDNLRAIDVSAATMIARACLAAGRDLTAAEWAALLPDLAFKPLCAH